MMSTFDEVFVKKEEGGEEGILSDCLLLCMKLHSQVAKIECVVGTLMIAYTWWWTHIVPACVPKCIGP